MYDSRRGYPDCLVSITIMWILAGDPIDRPKYAIAQFGVRFNIFTNALPQDQGEKFNLHGATPGQRPPFLHRRMLG